MRRNSRKSERDEGGRMNPSRKQAASRVTEFVNGPQGTLFYFWVIHEQFIDEHAMRVGGGRIQKHSPTRVAFMRQFVTHSEIELMPCAVRCMVRGGGALMNLIMNFIDF